MSHEIRTPLNAIIGFGQLLSRDETLSIDHRDQVMTIKRSGEHLLALINDILEISKIESGRITLDYEPVDFVSLLDEVKSIFALKVDQKNITFEIETIGTFDKLIIADPKKLRQILLNIVGNAVKFTNDGGVVVTAQVEPTNEEEGKLKCSIRDSAHGISEEEIGLIFNPFEQATGYAKKVEGTGLGLAITKSFIEKMGGIISVESTVGVGSEFYFEIPVEFGEDSHHTVDHTLSIDSIQVAGSISVMICDDKKSNRDLLEKILKVDNINLFICQNGQEAVDLVKSTSIDLAFMDLMMPVMDGYEATKKIKELTGGSTIVCAVTASVFSREADGIKSKGFDYIIRKPFRTEEIYKTLVEACEEVEILNEEITVEHEKIELDYTGVPEKLKEEMLEAVMLGEIEKIKDIVETNDSVNEQIKTHIITLCNEFNIDELSAVIEKLHM